MDQSTRWSANYYWAFFVPNFPLMPRPCSSTEAPNSLLLLMLFSTRSPGSRVAATPSESNRALITIPLPFHHLSPPFESLAPSGVRLEVSKYRFQSGRDNQTEQQTRRTLPNGVFLGSRLNFFKLLLFRLFSNKFCRYITCKAETLDLFGGCDGSFCIGVSADLRTHCPPPTHQRQELSARLPGARRMFLTVKLTNGLLPIYPGKETDVTTPTRTQSPVSSLGRMSHPRFRRQRSIRGGSGAPLQSYRRYSISGIGIFGARSPLRSTPAIFPHEDAVVRLDYFWCQR